MRGRDSEGDLIEPRDVLDADELRTYADRQRALGSQRKHLVRGDFTHTSYDPANYQNGRPL